MVDSPEQLYCGNMGVPADSRNREMMVASSEQLTVAKVGLCDLTAHYSLLLRRNDRGESFPEVVLCTQYCCMAGGAG